MAVERIIEGKGVRYFILENGHIQRVKDKTYHYPSMPEQFLLTANSSSRFQNLDDIEQVNALNKYLWHKNCEKEAKKIRNAYFSQQTKLLFIKIVNNLCAHIR